MTDEKKQLQVSTALLKKHGVDMNGMKESQINQLAQTFNSIKEQNTIEAHNDRMKIYKGGLVQTLKPLVKALAESAEKSGLVSSEIGIESVWSKGGSIELGSKDRVTFDIKFINPDADDEASKERKKVSKSFVEDQKSMLEKKIGLKDLGEYLRFKVQEKDSFKSGIFNEHLDIGEYKVQFNLGYSKYVPKDAA